MIERTTLEQYQVIDVDSFFKDSVAGDTADAGTESDAAMSESGDPAEADSIDAFLAEDDEQSARQLLDQAVANRQQGNQEQADEQLEEIVRRFPKTTVAREARQLMEMKVPTEPAVAADEVRIWTDKSGRHQMQASFVDRLGTTIRLRRSNGKIFTVELDVLSDFDRRYVDQYHPDKKNRDSGDTPEDK